MSCVCGNFNYQLIQRSNAGGGGERVLWTAVKHLQAIDPGTVILIYSGDYPVASKDQILAKVVVSKTDYS